MRGSVTVPSGPGKFTGTELSPPATKADVDALLAQIAALSARVAVLEQGRGPRDDADAALVQAIHEAAAGLPFRAGMVFRRAALVPALATALRNADIDNEKQLGKLLDRVKGIDIQGVIVTRVGRFWQCRLAM